MQSSARELTLVLVIASWLGAVYYKLFLHDRKSESAVDFIVESLEVRKNLVSSGIVV